MMTAMLTVRNILAGRQVHDVWNVNQDAEYHEAGDRGAESQLAGGLAGSSQAAGGLRDVPRRVTPTGR
jgi:hypothetical protein